MKNKLLATTVLAGLAFATLGTAADASVVSKTEHVEIELNGYSYFQIRVWDQDFEYLGVGDRNYIFDHQDQEFHVTGRYLADNGLKYGVQLQFNAAASDSKAVDEAYIFIEGPFGRLVLGDDDTIAVDFLHDAGAVNGRVYFPDALAEFNIGQDVNGNTFAVNADFVERFAPAEKDGDDPAGQTLTGNFPSAVGDATKISYFTPRFYGFKLGVSWTPDSGQNGDMAACDNDATDVENVITVGLEYVNEWDNGLAFAASITYEHGEAELDQEVDDGVIVSIDNDKNDLQIFHIGGNIEYRGITLGAGYYNYFDSLLTDAQEDAGADSGHGFNVALGYVTGPWDFSIFFNYFERDYQDEIENNDDSFDISLENYHVGGTIAYTVAPGWTVAATVVHAEAEFANAAIGAVIFGNDDNEAKRDNEMTSFTIDCDVKF